MELQNLTKKCDFSQWTCSVLDAADRGARALFFLATKTENMSLRKQCQAMIEALGEEYPILSLGPAARRLLSQDRDSVLP